LAAAGGAHARVARGAADARAPPRRSVEYIVGGGGGHELYIRRFKCVAVPAGTPLASLDEAPQRAADEVVFTVSGAGSAEVRRSR
jgi:hypothetical protein